MAKHRLIAPVKERCILTTPSKHKDILKAAIIIAIIVVSSFGAVFYLLTYDNVTVSGQAFAPTGLWGPFLTVQKLQFQDTQSGTITTFQFHFGYASGNTFGNYSVILKNGHTYNVFLSYFVGSDENPQTDFETTFTVNATAGQTTITKDF